LNVAPTIAGTSVVVATRDQVSSDLGGEAAILDLKSETYYGLNSVAARVWQLIRTPTTAREVWEAVAAEYDVEADRCERDVLALLQKLADAGLVDVANETPT
jgi:hypothetical protein